MKAVGLLLAGGASRRFGSEKAMAFFADGVLMEAPLQALAAVCHAVCVSAPAERGAAAMAQTCGYPVLPDPPAAPTGPLAGILAGLHWAQAQDADLLIVAPCDAATLAPEMLAAVAAAATASHAAAAQSPRGLEPLVSAWPVSLSLAAVEAAVGHPSIAALLKDLGVVCVPGFDGLNVNAPEDLPATAAERADPDHGRLFAFEDDFVRTLRCIPMCIRFKLDATGVKLSLRQWSRFTLADRQELRFASCGRPDDVAAFRDRLVELVARRSDEPVKDLVDPPPTAWREIRPPRAVQDMARARTGRALTQQAWSRLDELQRYALVKLTRDKHENANFVPALREFGALEPAGGGRRCELTRRPL